MLSLIVHRCAVICRRLPAPARELCQVTGQLADTPTRGLPTRGLDKSRTGQLAVSQMPPKERKLSTQSRRWHPRAVQAATCPVLELTSPRVVQSASWQSASWRIRELSSNPLSPIRLTRALILDSCTRLTSPRLHDELPFPNPGSTVDNFSPMSDRVMLLLLMMMMMMMMMMLSSVRSRCTTLERRAIATVAVKATASHTRTAVNVNRRRSRLT